jgi:hypothetical protein
MIQPGDAVTALARLGFCFRLAGEAIKVRYIGLEKPDQDHIALLLESIKSHKAEVLKILASCAGCPQYMAREIEAGFPSFCLYWGEGLLINNPVCRDYREKRVSSVTVCCLRCGGVVSCPDLGGQSRCLSCDWDYLTSIYSGLKQRR